MVNDCSMVRYMYLYDNREVVSGSLEIEKCWRSGTVLSRWAVRSAGVYIIRRGRCGAPYGGGDSVSGRAGDLGERDFGGGVLQI